MINEPSWNSVLQTELSKPYFAALQQFVAAQYRSGQCYPPNDLIFDAFEKCPFDKVKVVILGQDPYHGPGQANGHCFSVNDGVAFPPSLRNIFRELNTDVGAQIPFSGNLSHWARQGVLLLNATLTVQAGNAASHQKKGWEEFTDFVIETLSVNRDHLVFMLWGTYAKKKGSKIDREKHLVLESGHPSPMSANAGHWFGNRHFSKANEYLKQHGKTPINWASPL